MDIVGFSISKPVTVTVTVLLVVMFGLIGLKAIPIQLTPTVDQPVVTVQTNWPGRSPQEIVDDITKEQEERLKNVENLKSMTSASTDGGATITLEFTLGTNIDQAKQDVSDALRQVPDYPQDVTQPTITAADGAGQNAIAWIILDLSPEGQKLFPDFDITTLQHAAEKRIQPMLERIDGVAQVNVFGGRQPEVHLRLDPIALAQRQLSAQEVIQAVRQQNQNTSAGSIAEGKRDYRIRVMGQYTSVDEILATVITYRNGLPVYVHDVGDAQITHARQRGFVRSLGSPSLAINMIRQTDANVMDLMAEARQRLDEIRRDVLPTLNPQVGKYLRLRQVYDETDYITSAINLVTNNLWIGGLIAAGVLLLFLRSFIATGVIALAIPISVIGTFLVLLGLGRTLNVVSLAGLAFAVGMVVDNAIVVLENIHRRLQLGDSPMQAAHTGGREVWGAILASTLTTIAVFVPILTIQEEAGQLFRDISLAIVASVTLSLIVSITVIPAACSRWLRPHAPSRAFILKPLQSLFGLAFVATLITDRLSRGIAWLNRGWAGFTLRPGIVLAMTAISLFGAAQMMPPLDYLPAGNRNLVFGGLLIPPAYSVAQMRSIAERIEDRMRPYLVADINDPDSVASLAPIPRWGAGKPFDAVPVENMFIGAFGGTMFCGATSQDPQRVIPIGTLLSNAMQIPDTYGGAGQSSIFGRNVGGSSSINVDISGPDLSRVTAAASMMFGESMGVFGPRNVGANPANFNLSQQEWRVRINEAGRELGITATDLGLSVRGLVDGVLIGDYQLMGDPVDLIAISKPGSLAAKESLASIPITTPAGRVVPLDMVADISPSLAPQQIRRVEEQSAVTISIKNQPGTTVQETIALINEQLIAPTRAAGLIDSTMRVKLTGTAARLDEVKTALFGSSTAAPDKRVVITTRWIGIGVAILGLVLGLVIAARSMHQPKRLYGSAGVVLLSILVGLIVIALGMAPELATARFVWALVVTYLLMCALFESFSYPFVIMLSVPLAIVGGFAGLRFVHNWTAADPTIAPQQFDVLTMLGFVILVGVVVNNAILIVHRARALMQGDSTTSPMPPPMPPELAIAQSVRSRVRPIFMSTLTSVGGMLPLVLVPGAGSEMYRGLGSVVIGGLLIATIFTLLLVPLMLGLIVDMRQGIAQAMNPKGSEKKPTHQHGL